MKTLAVAVALIGLSVPVSSAANRWAYSSTPAVATAPPVASQAGLTLSRAYAQDASWPK